MQNLWDALLVKSPKGTGKTQWLESIVKRCRKKGQTILLIGHRQSLIQAVAARLNLTSYISFHEYSKGDFVYQKTEYNKPTYYYAICADSLSTQLDPKVNKYDVVLIDEVEQVFSHLTSNTLKNRRNETFQFFKHYVDTAKELYVLDADLNRLTVETMYSFIRDKEKPVTIIVNDYAPTDKQLYLYQDKQHLTRELIESIDSGQRCFVCSNSKKTG